MSVFHNNILAGAAGQTGGAVTPTGYRINRSLRFNRADDAHLSRTISTKYTTFTTSCWVKRASFNTWQYIWAQYDGSAYRGITFGQGSDKLSLYDGNHVYTTAVFRDPAAWYHIVLKCSSGAATLYVNNTQVSTTTNFFIGGGSFRIGDFITGSNEFDGYIADFHAVLGTAHDPTDFAEYDDNNNWNPKKFSGNFGSDGFHLDFSDNTSNAALGYDQSVAIPSPNPDGGMDVVTYTGNGSTQTISGFGFQPDFVWIKNRGATGNHTLWDVVRGANERLMADTTDIESTRTGGLTEFTSDGFIHGNDGTGNTNNNTYVAWGWKAGGAPTTLTAGSVDAQVSVNTEYGFSIITATMPSTANLGCTVAHGLGSAPAWYIVKDRDLGVGWGVYHSGMSNAASNALQLNSNGSVISGGYWRNEAPTSSVLSISASIVAENDDFVVYAWAEVSGFSKFGSYTGNGSSTGPTVTTGFKPRYVLIKRTDSAGNWGIYDTERGGFTDNNKTLLADTSGSESTDNNKISITSTGFSPASGFANVNANGGAYIYAAFADRPGNNFDVNNLVATAGADGAAGFDAVTYTGTGSTQSISGLKFQPDFVWIKNRDSASYGHRLVDSVRGSTKYLMSHSTGAEATDSNGVTSFNSDGFTVGSSGDYNVNGNNFVAWAWKAGGTAVSNNSGSIPATVSANNTYGFSIVKYEGTGANGTVAHGLSTAPKFFFGRNLDDTSSSLDWIIYHESIGNTGRLKFTTGATSTSSTFFQNTSPSNSLITIGTSNDINKDNDNYILYCW